MNIYIEHFCRCLCSFIHKYYQQLISNDTTDSSIRQVFADDVTYRFANNVDLFYYIATKAAMILNVKEVPNDTSKDVNERVNESVL